MQPIQQFSARVLSELIRRQPASQEKTAFAWQLAVGPALARVTTVELAEHVLCVRVSDARWVVEVRRARPLVLARLQQLLGPDAVTRIDIDSL
jgi:predicted nucleic acid-binding Zn ribbon protein